MKLPTMKSVESSNLDAIGFNDQLGLVVRFKSGALYHYAEADKGVYDAALEIVEAGGSVGSWFRSAVVGNFRHQQIHQ